MKPQCETRADVLKQAAKAVGNGAVWVEEEYFQGFVVDGMGWSTFDSPSNGTRSIFDDVDQ